MKKNVIEVKNLEKYFEVNSGFLNRNKSIVKAVDNISFDIPLGESLGLVGQSGCGKTTTARSLCLLVQDPYESLNPRWTIKDIILEPLNIHNIGSLNDREEAVKEILTTVGLTPPENYMPRYPHELSGGQRQRVSIARTLVMKPKFVVCDEPTSMLDVSIRISIMDLMLNLAKDLEVSYLYITHDLAVARYMCNRIAVMFNGKIVEIAETEDLLKNPVHPYTKRLISSIPVPDPQYQRQEYELNYDELDEIIRNNPDTDMVDIGGNHYIATHDVKDSLY